MHHGFTQNPLIINLLKVLDILSIELTLCPRHQIIVDVALTLCVKILLLCLSISDSVKGIH